MKKMITSAVAAVVALTTMISGVPAFAVTEQETYTYHVSYVPDLDSQLLYEISGDLDYSLDGLSDADLQVISDMGQQMREGMKAHDDTVVVSGSFDTNPSSIYQEISSKIISIAVEHTGDPKEGDYIGRQYRSIGGSISISHRNGKYELKITYTVHYFTTKEQEEMVDEEVGRVLASLELDGKTDYEKVKAIYDYLCANVTYDWDGYYDSTSVIEHSAYSALIRKTAVCQGYATALYRLMLEEGIDCRYIAGTANGGSHGWNIVKLSGKYYLLDSTWDATNYKWGFYEYFLTCSKHFYDHTPSAAFTTEEFTTQYPISDSCYDPERDGRAVTGTVSLAGDEDITDITVVLTASNNKEYEAEILSNGTFVASAVPDGKYTLTADKDGYVARTYSVTVKNGTATTEVAALLKRPGDVSGDGKITAVDSAMVNAYVMKTGKLDAYDQKVADVIGNDGAVTAVDCSRINAHVQKTNLLW